MYLQQKLKESFCARSPDTTYGDSILKEFIQVCWKTGETPQKTNSTEYRLTSNQQELP